MRDGAADEGKVQGASRGTTSIRPGRNKRVGPGTGRLLEERGPFLHCSQQDLIASSGTTLDSVLIREPEGRVPELRFGPGADPFCPFLDVT